MLVASGCSGGSGAAPSIPPGVSVVDRVSGADAAELIFYSFLGNVKALDSDAALSYLCDADRHRDEVDNSIALLADVPIDERYRGETGTGDVRDVGADRYEVVDEFTVVGAEAMVVGNILFAPSPCVESIDVVPSTARMSRRPTRVLMLAACQSLAMMRCRSPRRSASSSMSVSAAAMSQDACIALASQSPV
jgi:hypothetical protein